MNKKATLILISLMMLSMLFLTGCPLGASTPAAAPSSSNVDFKYIITMQWLSELGLRGTGDPFEGFIRMLILIVMFAVLFKAAELLKMGRNISIVIALVFALISAIFIPGTVLVAAATAYGTIFSFLLLGLPIAAGLFIFYVLKGDSHIVRWIRFAVLALLIVVMHMMEGQLVTLRKSALAAGSAHFHNVILGVQETMFSWWFYGIFYVVAVIALLSALSRSGDSTVHHPNFLRRMWDQKVMQGIPQSDRARDLRHAKVEETRLLADIAAERDEHKEIEDTRDAGTLVARDFNTMNTNQAVNSKTELDAFNRHVDNLNNQMRDLDRKDHQWRRRQRQASGEMRRLITEANKNGVSHTTIANLRTREETIIEEFEKVRKALRVAQAALERVESDRSRIYNAFRAVYGTAGVNSSARVHVTPPAGAGAVPAIAAGEVARVRAALTRGAADSANLLIELNKARAAEKEAMNRTATLATTIHDAWLLPTPRS